MEKAELFIFTLTKIAQLSFSQTFTEFLLNVELAVFYFDECTSHDTTDLEPIVLSYTEDNR